MRPLSHYKHLLKTKGFHYCFSEAWRKIQRFHFIEDKQILETVWEYKIHKRLKKEYAHYTYTHTPDSTNPYPDKIWTCWLQGEDNAPEIVKRCLASIRLYAGKREVIVITEKNIEQYVTFPAHIIRKKQKGIITNTHFSDILRIYLLAQYGGIWMDATVYQTSPLPEYISQAPLFCFKASPASSGRIKMSSWFIVAHPNQEIIAKTKDILTDYWAHHNWLCHYFLFHLLFSITIDSTPELQRQWKTIPYIDSIIPHTLGFEIQNLYTEERWQQIKQTSFVHKLTWKTDFHSPKGQFTFLEKVLN